MFSPEQPVSAGAAAYQIKCPHCGAELEVGLTQSIDPVSDPEAKKLLLCGELNRVTCTNCDYMFLVDVDLIYHDREKKLIVYLVSGAEDRWKEAEETVRRLLAEHLIQAGHNSAPLPSIHVVFSRSELVERILLVEKGYDVRAIEYVKYLIFTRNASQVNPRTKRLLFNAEDSNEEKLWFVVQDIPSRKLEKVLEFSRAAYQAVCETFQQPEGARMLQSLFPGPVISARLKLLAEESETEETTPPPFHSDSAGAEGASGSGKGRDSDSG